jgi:hypothetical protein
MLHTLRVRVFERGKSTYAPPELSEPAITRTLPRVVAIVWTGRLSCGPSWTF